MLVLNIFVRKLGPLGVKNQVVTIEEKRVVKARTLGQHLVQTPFNFNLIFIRRGKYFSRVLYFGKQLFNHLLFADVEDLLKIAMNGGLERLVTFERAQLAVIYI